MSNAEFGFIKFVFSKASWAVMMPDGSQMQVSDSLSSAVEKEPHVAPKGSRLVIEERFRGTMTVHSTLLEVNMPIEALPESRGNLGTGGKKQVVETIDDGRGPTFAAEVGWLKR